jgi:hypothetical protein
MGLLFVGIGLRNGGRFTFDLSLPSLAVPAALAVL